MPYWPESAAEVAYASYPIGAPTTPEAAYGLEVTSSGSPNTKGSYFEFVASSAFTSNLCFVEVQLASATPGVSVQHLFDIAIGAGGAETVVVPNMTLSNHEWTNWHHGAGLYRLRLAIPAGTRISGRSQASVGSGILRVNITLGAVGDTPGIPSYVNYGAATGDSGSTSVDPGGSANTKGAYAELTASTSAVVQELCAMFTLGSNGAAAEATWAVDIASGPGGSETVILADLRTQSSGFGGGPFTRSYTLLTYIAAGVRLAARASCTSTDATDRLIEVALLCGTAP